MPSRSDRRERRDDRRRRLRGTARQIAADRRIWPTATCPIRAAWPT